MVAPLSFRDNIPSMIGGSEVVLADVRIALATTHPLTRAGNASKIKPESARKHVVAVILHTLKERLRGPLGDLLVEHLQNVEAEYEMLNGEQPDSVTAVDNAVLWNQGLLQDMRESFSGDVELVIGPQVLYKLVFSEASVEELVAAILAPPIQDEARALAVHGITDEDLEALVNEVLQPPFVITGAFLQPSLDDLDSSDGLVDEDFLDGEMTVEEALMHAAVEDMFDDGEISSELVAAGSFANLQVAEGVTGIDLLENGAWIRDGQPAHNSSDMVAVHGSAEPVKRQRGRPHLPAPTELSKAAQEALVAVFSYSAMTESGVAAEIGVSRAQMNKYRTGATPWKPTDKQYKALMDLIQKHAHGLLDAGCRLTSGYECPNHPLEELE